MGYCRKKHNRILKRRKTFYKLVKKCEKSTQKEKRGCLWIWAETFI